ncbi:MAG: AAA family ATPase [Tissierellia bacterium]|nr:AAA family ATPase [Tissierellia bacterium]
MKYIRRVTLENFQSHKHSTLEFDKKLNVIVGSSDSGKTAIIRGLKWVLYNEPSGDYFIREGENESSVTLEFNDNTILKRYRSKSKNQYILIKNNGKEMIFEGFGTNIPEEIVDAIGIKKIYLDSSEYNSINLGEQLEGPFLLSEKSSTRASAIGRLVGVNIIDDALRDVLKDTRALNITQKSLETSSISLKEEIEDYNYLEDLEIKLDKITIIRNKILDNKIRLERYNKIYNKLNEINCEIKQLSIALNELNKINYLIEKVKDIENKLLKYKYLNINNINIIKTRNEINQYSSIALKLKNLSKYQNNVLLLEDTYKKYDRFTTLLNKRNLYSKEIENINIIINKVNKTFFISKNIEKISISTNRLNKLNYYSNLYNNINKNIKIGKSYIDKFKYIGDIDNKVLILSNNLNSLNNMHKLYEQYSIFNKNIIREEQSIKNVQSEINTQLNRYQNILKEIEICPYCFSNIDEIKIEHIINHYIGG